jgi:hypothetical protein
MPVPGATATKAAAPKPGIYLDRACPAHPDIGIVTGSAEECFTIEGSGTVSRNVSVPDVSEIANGPYEIQVRWEGCDGSWHFSTFIPGFVSTAADAPNKYAGCDAMKEVTFLARP